MSQYWFAPSVPPGKSSILSAIVKHHDQRCRLPYQTPSGHPTVSYTRQVVSFFLTGRLGQIQVSGKQMNNRIHASEDVEATQNKQRAQNIMAGYAEGMKSITEAVTGAADGAICPRALGSSGPYKVRQSPVFCPLRSQEALLRNFAPRPPWPWCSHKNHLYSLLVPSS